MDVSAKHIFSKVIYTTILLKHQAFHILVSPQRSKYHEVGKARHLTKEHATRGPK